MELRYYINSTLINEPIGFDDFKTQLKRTEQHGVSAESSVGSLEFYGGAYDIVKTAYNTDIDTELVFKAEIKCDDSDIFEELYQGVIDLASFEDSTTDYCSCKCKIGEVGVKTTFNNRVDTKVNIAALSSLDGDVLSAYSNIDKVITIPAKGIRYKTELKNNTLNPTITTSVNFPNTVMSIKPAWDECSVLDLGINPPTTSGGAIKYVTQSGSGGLPSGSNPDIAGINLINQTIEYKIESFLRVYITKAVSNQYNDAVEVRMKVLKSGLSADQSFVLPSLPPLNVETQLTFNINSLLSESENEAIIIWFLGLGLLVITILELRKRS